MSRLWNSGVPSDGLTLDTPAGPVDLVAVERVMVSYPTRLTLFEKQYLDRFLTGDHEQAARVAEGMGVTLNAVLARVTRCRAAETGRCTA